MKRNKHIVKASTLFFLAAVAFAATTLPAAALSTYWQADPAIPASWHDPLNWTAGVPVAGDFAYIDNGGTALISANFAAVRVYAGYDLAGYIEQSGGSGPASGIEPTP
jgi:hypothetical protein